MTNLPVVKIKDVKDPVILIQGGMGVGVSLAPLAKAVSKRGCIGTVSSVALDIVYKEGKGEKVGTRKATEWEIGEAKSDGGFIAINCMVAVQQKYENSIFGALDAKVDAIISGAGLPFSLPEIVDRYEPDHDVALIPIISSARVLSLILKRWGRQNKKPDAVVLEGPLAGGHLGFHFDELEKEENKLENLFPDVKKMAKDNGNFPVIVAGGIFTRQDIAFWIDEMKADGVQIGSRFAATFESSASDEFKQAIINSTKESIIVPRNPGSPCGLPFRLIDSSPGYKQALARARRPNCSKGYVLRKDREEKFTICDAKSQEQNSFCICNVLINAAGRPELADNAGPIFTIGSRGWEIDQIISTDELLDELGVLPTTNTSP